MNIRSSDDAFEQVLSIEDLADINSPHIPLSSWETTPTPTTDEDVSLLLGEIT